MNTSSTKLVTQGTATKNELNIKKGASFSTGTFFK